MMSTRYIGRPWRSRFLRSPKHALEIAAREDFIALGEIATVRLGLKTGFDRFFYVVPMEGVPATIQLGARRARARLRVRGLLGWEGTVSAADLRPAIRNPHELFGDQGRRFSIPRATGVLYLYPQDRAPAAQLGDYVSLAEREGVHQRPLVRENGDQGGWYRQVRGIITPPWALPYNSAYDYGAWDNGVGAVLNGRFVGVEAKDEVDPDLLGASLNSTFVVMTRLLEGTATGVEAAYDVGPPAARLVRVPDPRRFGSGGERVKRILNEMRSQDIMPGAPDTNARVDSLRHELDTAILQALGDGRGDANYLVGSMYENYARWRRAVEAVERMMRTYRRQAQRRGVGRRARPTEVAAQRVWEEIASHFSLYPTDHLRPGDELEMVPIASGFAIGQTEPMFHQGIVPTPDGGEIDLGDFGRARYASMLLDIGFSSPVSILEDPTRSGQIADLYENDRARLRNQAAELATRYVGSTDSAEVASLVERLWKRECRSSGMTPPSSSE